MSMDKVTPERTPQLNAIQSPVEIGPLPHQLAGNEQVVIQDFGIGAEYPTTSWQFPDGREVEGRHALTILIGGEEDFATIDVVDLSENPMIEQGAGYYRNAAGYGDNQAFPTAGNFAIIVKDKQGRPRSFGALASEKMWKVGRAEDAVGNDWLPDTVSRDHLAIGINKEGRLVVENHNPTNKTAIEKPGIYDSPEYAYRPRSINIDTVHFDGEVKLPLQELAPISDENETAHKLGVAGEVIGNVAIDNGAVNALIVRRLTTEGTMHSVVRTNEDGSLNVTALRSDQEVTLENKEEHEGSIVVIKVDEQGVLHMREVRRWILYPDASTNRISVNKAESPYRSTSAKLPEKPRPTRPLHSREAQRAIDPRTSHTANGRSLVRQP